MLGGILLLDVCDASIIFIKRELTKSYKREISVKVFAIHTRLKVFKSYFERVQGCVKYAKLERVALYKDFKYTFYKHALNSVFPTNIKTTKNLTTNVVIYIIFIFFCTHNLSSLYAVLCFLGGNIKNTAYSDSPGVSQGLTHLE